MATTEKLTALACIHYNGGVYCPGSEAESFDCDPKEAKRLKSLGLAEPFVAAASEPSDPSDKSDLPDESGPSDLLAQIAAAETEDAVLALLPAEPPADQELAAQLQQAAEARLAELRG